jgi:hypothetical protein
MRLKIITYFITILSLAGCKPTAKQDIAFYYWRRTFLLSPGEDSALKNNNCKTLYLKYFDVVKKDGLIKPEAVIAINQTLPELKIVPVVFIKNEVFAETDQAQIEQLARKILSLIDQINFSNALKVHEIQWDCDWTEKTKDHYFLFLKCIKKIFRETISATIRLHQVKYKSLTGIPPVDKGILMYYNMNSVSGGEKNSIYEKNTSNKYLNSLRDYSLQLDIALPVFTWGIHSRDGKVVGLLNKMNESYFANDTNFTSTSKGLSAKHACFKEGYYFREGDNIKVEAVMAEELLEMAEDIKTNLSSWPSEIIFYDLDSLNLSRYDKNIFKNVLDKFN